MQIYLVLNKVWHLYSNGYYVDVTKVTFVCSFITFSMC